jgi:aspartate/methionine/tyrosine aminotransferase
MTAGAAVVAFDPRAADASRAIAEELARLDAPLAAVVACNPGNPTGSVLANDAIDALADLAGQRDATLVVDECYTDLWLTRPIDGSLRLVERRKSPCRILVLHTLSKRSGAPGLRSGFVAGDSESVAAYAEFNRTCGVSLARPVCAVSAALWRDEEHVVRLREALLEAWRSADKVLGDLPGYRRPAAGFFLWLPVDDGEATARALWHEAALLTMPGLYLTDDSVSDPAKGKGEAAARLRVALVHPPEILVPALTRLRDIVAARSRPPV